jgi:dihydrofolate reductase
MSARVTFDVVVAADEGGAIGKVGELPWKLPGDTAFFKRITSEAAPGKINAVIMGRKTWDTIPPRFRPLGARVNAVVTRHGEIPVPPGVLVVGSIDEALFRLAERSAIDRVFVIGGGEIYRLAVAMPECRRVYLTRVEGRRDADAFFPTLGPEYALVEESPRHEENGTGYRFQIWERTAG